MNDGYSDLVGFVTALSRTVDRFVKVMTPHIEPVVRGMLVVSERQRISKLLVEAGWLYHKTIPLELVAEPGVQAVEVSTRLWQYYEENWTKIRPAIESQFDAYDVDEEAKATIREALDAHGLGLYRCVCRLVFPEIERVLRIQLFGHVVGRQSYRRIIESLVEDRALSDLLPGGWYDFDYVSHLMMALEGNSESVLADQIFGLFRDVQESDLVRLDQDPVPNRHAAMHGYVPYASLLNSLNAIFVTDYVFRLVSSLGNIPIDGEG